MRDLRRARLVLALLILTSITLIIIDLRGGSGGPLQPLRSVAAAVFGPLERGAAAVVSPVRSLVDGVSSWGDQQDLIDELQAENERLRVAVDANAVERARVEALDALLGLASDVSIDIVPAQVIAVGPAQGFAWTVTIDVGSRDGAETGMSVLNGGGLVGRIVSVGPDTATVLLVVDATSTVGGRLAGSAQIGIVAGSGRQDLLTMQLLDPLAPVESGDVVVTFGSQGGRPYAPGIPIGVVESVTGTPGQLTRVANLTPYADVSTMSIVGVVVSQDRVAPRPTVSAVPLPTEPSVSGG
ncbi:MAG: rod shape-determining protein MreC [Candidatus Nanopelagicales bacterium]